MMPNRKILWALVSLAVISGGFFMYRTFFSFKTTDSGLKYRFIKGEPTKQVYSSDYYCLINYKIIGPEGDTLISTYGNDTLVEVAYPTEARNELTEALRLASPGSRVEILLSTDSLKLKNSSDYRVQLLPNGQEARVIFDLVQIISNQDYYKYLAEKTFKRTMAENKEIDEYAAKHPGKPWHLDSFEMIKYRLLSDTNDLFCNMWLSPNLFSNAPIHKAAEELEYDVVVKRLNGELIHDSRLEYKKYKASASGWLHPVKALNRLPFYVDEGMEMEFLVTSDYGFGAAGRIGVPSYSPLYVKIFNVKVIK